MQRLPLIMSAMALAIGVASAQDRPPTPPSPDAGAIAPVPPPPPGQPSANATRNGRVARFLVNPNGDVDGLLLADGTQVAMPPGLGNAVAAHVHRGDDVLVDGWRVGDLPLLQAAAVSAKGTRWTDRPPTAPPEPPALSPMEAHGQVAQPLYGPRGDINGAVLDDGTLLHLPPPASERTTAWATPHAPVSVKGFGVETRYGRSIQVTALGTRPGSEQPLAVPPQPGPLPPPPPAGVPTAAATTP
ncbi:hypothetical protein L2Y94_10795 [Luteibacter aegosomatis]|uniref:hypothetical protein n=1 Tax=Luteibacter aegosomatis TaxID=2911537 RepID=UPI001FF7F410|nr:hypothetical protein [Luteibacter aegosomatis]UPG83847.1 hypothetical protein L2Y94_10795 [Luteibacter aegosomatis]